VGLLLRSAEAQLGASVGSELGQTLGKALQELEAGLGELRTLARGLHPEILTDQGLMAALGALARRSAVPVKLRVAPLGVLPAGVETAAYFVVAEALTNVVKHAAASQVQVAIERSGATLLIEVADDGRGGATVSPGGGLGGLSDRVAALGGRLRLESSLRAGTLLQAELPCGESS